MSLWGHAAGRAYDSKGKWKRRILEDNRGKPVISCVIALAHADLRPEIFNIKLRSESATRWRRGDGTENFGKAKTKERERRAPGQWGVFVRPYVASLDLTLNVYFHIPPRLTWIFSCLYDCPISYFRARAYTSRIFFMTVYTSRESMATTSVTGGGSGVVTLFRTCSSRWSQWRCKCGKRLRSLRDSSEKADEAGAKETASNKTDRSDPAVNFMSTVAGDGCRLWVRNEWAPDELGGEKDKKKQNKLLIGNGGQGLDRAASSFKLIDLLTALPLEKECRVPF